MEPTKSEKLNHDTKTNPTKADTQQLTLCIPGYIHISYILNYNGSETTILFVFDRLCKTTNSETTVPVPGTGPNQRGPRDLSAGPRKGPRSTFGITPRFARWGPQLLFVIVFWGAAIYKKRVLFVPQRPRISKFFGAG